MIKFIKIKDPNNKFDTINVIVELPDEDITMPELLEAMETFIVACGYNKCKLEPKYDDE